MTRRDDQGAVTLWTLGLVLVVLFVGAISIDLWSAFSARRHLAATADAAAQAGANALDLDTFRTRGVRQLDAPRARQLALDSLAADQLDETTRWTVDSTSTQVVVELTTDVRTGLLSIFMPNAGPMTVHVRAVGEPKRGT